MAWVKNDDRMDDTPKVKKAWRRNRASVGLWNMAKTCTARHEADGLVLLEWIEEKLPEAMEREEVLTVLLDIGLFEKLPAGETRRVRVTRVKKGKPVDVRVTYGPCSEDGFIVHDYLEFNEARVESEERRRADAERKTKERGGKGQKSPTDDDDLSAQRPPGQTQDSTGTDDGLHAVSTSPDPTRPDPTHTQSLTTPPTPPAGGRAREKEKWEREFAAWLQAHPVTDDLLSVWEPLRERISERLESSPGLSIAFAEIHPHQLGDQPVLGGPRGPVELVRYQVGVLNEVLGAECRLIDCQCELTRKRAA